MAGTLFGLGLAVQYDASGVIAPGALLYVYEANTSTPVTTYSDFGLTVSQTWPIEADGSGRLPQIWVADGSYRARMTTSAGVAIFDEASVTAIGASSGGTTSGASVDATTVFQTGDVLWVPYAGTRSGWVRMNARTIGSASSGATERANADTSALYDFLWTNFSNSLCPVATGRGASSSADFSANKAIGILDMRGIGAFGLDDMGNTAAGVIAAGTPTVGGSGAGAETVTLTTANIPSYNLSLASLTVATTGTGDVKYQVRTDITAGGGNTLVTSISSSGTSTGANAAINITAAGTVGGTLPSGGGGSATNKMPPYRLGSWYIKLTWLGLSVIPVLKLISTGGIIA